MDDLEILDQWIDAGAHEVTQGEWDMAVAPERIVTAGLGPCTGILVHSPRKKRVVIAHLVDPRFEAEHFAELLKFVREGMGDVLGLEVYLAGVSPENIGKRHRRECESIRKHVEDSLRGLGIRDQQVRKAWGGPDESASMGADAGTGKVVVTKFDYGYLTKSGGF